MNREDQEALYALKDEIQNAAREGSKFPFQSQLKESQRKKFAERLLTIANVIKAVSPKQYQHDSWVSQYRPNQHCGSTACAMGHACCNPKLFSGLPFRVIDETPEETDPNWKTYEIEVVKSKLKNKDNDDLDDASEEYFGIGAMEAIFDADAHFGVSCHNVTKSMAIKRIEKFVRESYGYEYA
jgi:hypothetical protein